MRVIGVAGTKNTGKTILVTKIVSKLVERGFHVGTVKHTAEGFDLKGRDTWKHKEAGAELVVGAGDGTFLNLAQSMELDDILNLMRFVKSLDFVILEGFKHSKYAKISTSDYKDEFTIKNVDVREITDEDVELLLDLIEERSFGLIQNLNCKKCGFESCREFQIAKVTGKAGGEVQCLTESDDVVLKVDGIPIPMNPFVKNFVRNITHGMVDSLRTSEFGAKDSKRIELFIKKGT